jgi:hypothetical protein
MTRPKNSPTRSRHRVAHNPGSKTNFLIASHADTSDMPALDRKDTPADTFRWRCTPGKLCDPVLWATSHRVCTRGNTRRKRCVRIVRSVV